MTGLAGLLGGPVRAWQAGDEAWVVAEALLSSVWAPAAGEVGLWLSDQPRSLSPTAVAAGVQAAARRVGCWPGRGLFASSTSSEVWSDLVAGPGPVVPAERAESVDVWLVRAAARYEAAVGTEVPMGVVPLISTGLSAVAEVVSAAGAGGPRRSLSGWRCASSSYSSSRRPPLPAELQAWGLARRESVLLSRLVLGSVYADAGVYGSSVLCAPLDLPVSDVAAGRWAATVTRLAVPDVDHAGLCEVSRQVRAYRESLAVEPIQESESPVEESEPIQEPLFGFEVAA